MSNSLEDHRPLHTRPAGGIQSVAGSHGCRPIPAAAFEENASTDLRRVLAIVAGMLAAAGGLIHIVVIRDHLDFAVIAVGFAVMAAAQWAFALRMLTRPSRQVLLLGGALHAVIVALWVLSRMTGLGVIPGAEAAEPVGVADLVSTTFSLGVIGIVAIARSLDQATKPVMMPQVVARRMIAIILAGALFLTVPAVLVPHDHDAHPSDSHTSGMQDGHGQEPVAITGGHDHSPSSTAP